MTIKRLLVYLWTFPTTLVGLLATLLTLLTGGHARWHTGVLEVYGGFASFLRRRLVPLPGGAAAMTLGHVVLARDPACHTASRDHERVHVRQCERWGAFFIPAYLIMCGVMKLRGKKGYRDNPFEREAYDNS